MSKILTLILLLATFCIAKAQEVITLQIEQPPLIEISLGEDKTINEGEQAALEAFATGGTPDYYFTWMDSQPLSKTGPDIDVEPEDTTVYIVTVQDRKNCIARDTIAVNVIPKIIGVGETTEGLLSVYPNPVSDFFYIGLGHVEGIVTVQLLAMDGKEIWLETLNANGLEKAWFSTPKANGMYVLKITNGEQSFTQTIVVSK